MISFVLQVLLFDCIFSMRLLHQCRLERQGLSLGVLCFTLELCCLGLLRCDSGRAEYLEQTEKCQEVSYSSGREKCSGITLPVQHLALELPCG